MSEKITVIIEDIADALDMTMDCWEQFLNTATGEIVSLSDGSYVETDEELAEQIDGSDDYVRLPNQREIEEYRIMEDFADVCPDAGNRGELYRALNGRKPFRHFKDALKYAGIEEDYYAFRFLALVDIAGEWCEAYKIPYKHRDAGQK